MVNFALSIAHPPGAYAGVSISKGASCMEKSRTQAALSILKGLLVAIMTTLLLMAAVAALSVWLRLSDGLLTALNQAMKLLSLLLGTLAAVGRGGHRGFITGMTLALLYMALGYAGYVGLGGSAWNTGEMLGELLIGAALGALIGAVISNLPQRRKTA